ncbi:tRNA pseudouridine(55) synthase TruB [Ramlibacter rhizophilus]|uniref:tRNA pseudouridine synthase B n=1 Tax=Ramlibacter rhizophilus TaxID=1781167 RepID=A0A4Z0C079_9BURK|nr:tRNA pseudouridine(55) synthase TruB [Ramlibacter rhizophilus]TFZ04936.1 tRNA pseudouridine(55) synthase TruB [Ramlibacter rhizophilus]
MSAPRARVVRRPVHGVLLLDKPRGLSSNDALQKAKWLLRAEKAGHTGTLDPLATGVLPLCFGAATKFSQLQLEADKTYEAVAVLGVRTTTADAEGDVVEQRPVPAIDTAALDAVRQRFTGRIRQLPPMHSALKKDGKALYEYARAGQEVERAEREVSIHALELEWLGPNAEGHPALRIAARVSKGTYIRTLGEDIGLALGCGAYLSSLRRLATGHYDVAHCTTVEALEAMSEQDRLGCLLPPQSLLEGHAPVMLGSEDAGRFLSGVRRRGAWPDCDAVAVFGPGGAAGSVPAEPFDKLRANGIASVPAEPFDKPRANAMTSVRAEPVEALSTTQGGRSRALSSVLLGTGHVKAGELIPGRLLSPIEIQQILSS